MAICKYVDPDRLHDELMGLTADGEVVIPKISLRSAKKMARNYLSGQMVSIDDSEDENAADGKEAEDAKSLTFSLICPISKTAMKTPVRGRYCKHIQVRETVFHLI